MFDSFKKCSAGFRAEPNHLHTHYYSIQHLKDTFFIFLMDLKTLTGALVFSEELRCCVVVVG